jgi:Myb-like DNA-binding domain
MIKPKSMPVGQRNILRPNDSLSLWNYTLSPGWTKEEAETLCNAVVRFGIGDWSAIFESECLPGKTNAQLNLQLQRMLGQQSTAEFQGLHIDPRTIYQVNSLKTGPDVKRKGGMLVNTGGRISKAELKSRIQANKEKYYRLMADMKWTKPCIVRLNCRSRLEQHHWKTTSQK